MSASPSGYSVDPWEEGISSGTCDCCGHSSRTVWGEVVNGESAVAVYYVSWAIDDPNHDTTIDLVMGRWGEYASPNDRFLVSLRYRPGGGFMVVDAAGRPPDDRGICRIAYRREQVIETPMAKVVFDLVDAIWLNDSRIRKI